MASFLVIILYLFLLNNIIIIIIESKKIAIPWQYHGYNEFPVLFFGASPQNLESISTMTLAARHEIVGWGWQQNNTGLPQEEENLYNQAKAFNKFYNNKSNNINHNTYSTFVYRSGSSANPFWKSLSNIVFDENYKDFWIQNPENKVCWQKKSGLYDYLQGGPMFNFSNNSAANYYLENVIKEISNDLPYINSVFFDLMDWAYCNYPYKSLTNCTEMESLSDDEKYNLGMAAINNVFIKAGEYLNSVGIIPIYSIKTVLNENGLMDNYTDCKISEEVWINKLENITWIRYQEYWPDLGDTTIKNNSVAFLNMIQELKYNLPIQVHAYGIKPNTTIDEYYIATFLIGQQNYSYFSCSDGWFDANWSWHNCYNNIYGKPLSSPFKINNNEYIRLFSKCNVSINIETRTAQISFF